MLKQQKESSGRENRKPQDELEEAFPRGGGDGLTAVERKQARIEAEQEVAQGKGRLKKERVKRIDFKEFDEDEDAEDGGGFPLEAAGKQSKRIDVLTFQNLREGMKIWGAVDDINEKDMVISLPCGLKAYVTKMEASDVLAEMMVEVGDDDAGAVRGQKRKKTAKRKEKAKSARKAKETVTDEHDEDVNEDLDEDVNESHTPSLNELFVVGQLVGCTVTSLRRVEGKKHTYKRVEVSLHLQKLYDDLSVRSVYQGMVLYACVKSIQDHGYLLSFGKGVALSGFLLKKDHHNEEGEPGPALKKGQLIQCAVTSIDKQRQSVLVQTNPKVVLSSTVREYDGLTVESLLPGALVNAKINSVMEAGLQVSFLTYFTGTVDRFHLAEEVPGLKWMDNYSQNQRIRARILYIDRISKLIGLSLNNQLVAGATPELNVSVGQVFKKAIIKRVDREVGLLLELSSTPRIIGGFAHISNVSDTKVEKLEQTFRLGKAVCARVTAIRWMDCIANVSLKKSVVDQDLMSYSDIKPGMIVKGTAVAVDFYGVILELSKDVRALCTLRHLSEIELTKPAAKFKVGMAMVCRVLSCDPETKKIEVTNKKTLVKSKLPIITSLEDAREGVTTHGWITGVMDYGVFVKFYNGVKGLVHKNDMGIDRKNSSPKDFGLTDGQVVKVRVLRDAESGKLPLSFIISQSQIQEAMEDGNWLHPGLIINGAIADVTDLSYMIDVFNEDGERSGWRGLLHFNQVADHSGHTTRLRELLKIGTRLEKLLVLEKEDKKRLVVLSAKHSLLSAASSMPKDASDIELNSFSQGYVKNITSAGVFVNFLNRLTGLARMCHLADTFVIDPEQHFHRGQTVRAQFIEFDEEKKRIGLNLRPSVCPPVDATLLQAFFVEEAKIAELSAAQGGGGDSELTSTKNFPIGSMVDGVVHEVKEYGIIVNLVGNEDVVGFMTNFQAGGNVKVGQKVTARVLDVTVVDNIIDLSVRKEVLAFEEDAEGKKGEKEGKKKKKHKNGNAGKIPKLFEVVNVQVELVKKEYLVVSLPDQGRAIGFAATHDYNLRNLNVHETFEPGLRLTAIIQCLADEQSGGRMLLHLTPKVFCDIGLGVELGKKRKRGKDEKPSYSQGQIVEAQVTEIAGSFMLAKVDKGVFGKVHITQVRDGLGDGSNPLSAFSVGKTVRARILEKEKVVVHDGKGKKGFSKMKVNLSLRESDLNEMDESSSSSAFPLLAQLDDAKNDQVLIGYVEKVADRWAWLTVSPTVKGGLHHMESSTNLEDLHNFANNMKVGKAMKVRVIDVDQNRKCLTLTTRGADGAWKTGEELVDFGFKKGEVVFGEIIRVGEGLVVKMPREGIGRVHMAELDDVWKDNPLDGFSENQYVRCTVLGLEKDEKKGDTRCLELSLRPSLGGCGGTEARSKRGVIKISGPIPRIDSVSELSQGQDVWCVVKTAFGARGCWVHLAKNANAFLQLSSLPMADQARANQVFPIGKLVKARVKSSDATTNYVELAWVPVAHSDKEASSRGASGAQVKEKEEEEERPKIDMFKEGQLVTGSVTRIEKFGVFVKVDQSSAVGLCHISQIGDGFVKSLHNLYKIGDHIRAKVTKVDVEGGRLSLGKMEPAERGESASNVAVNGGDKEGREMKGGALDTIMGGADGDAEVSDVEEDGTEDDDDDDADEKAASDNEAMENVEEGSDSDVAENDEDDDDEDQDEDDDDSDVGAAVEELHHDRKKRKVGEDVAPLDVDFGDLGAGDGNGHIDEADVKVKEDEDMEARKKKSKRAKRKAKEEREAAIQLAEKKRLEGVGAPETVDEFEQLVRSSPSSSYVWIKYMAYMITLGEIDKARGIADRALKTISYREEGEKMNVWVAFLNLENMYGNPPKEAVLKLFQRALMYTDQKKLYMALIGIYERTEQWDMADQIFKTMTKKFNMSSKVWLRNMSCLLKRGMEDAARKVMERSLLSLPKRKHIKMISRVALLEFKIGSAERGRAIMEGILRNFPKRVDLWSVYLDQEIKQGDYEIVRTLFERIICLDLPPKRMKFMFKKYLDFERSHGTPEGVEHVKTKAMAYVENKLGL